MDILFPLFLLVVIYFGLYSLVDSHIRKEIIDDTVKNLKEATKKLTTKKR